jgi:hypothetical protein
MFIVSLPYITSLEEIDKHLAGHVEFILSMTSKEFENSREDI